MPKLYVIYFSVARKLEGHLLMLERVAEMQLSGAHLEQQAKSEAEAEEEVFTIFKIA